MPDWIVCDGCGLKHSARPDGLCPRCRTPTGVGLAPPALAAPGAGPGGPPPPPPPPYAPQPAGAFPTGARVAGFLLYANAAVALVAMMRAGVQPTDPARGIGGLVPLVVDVLIGTLLVGGKEKVRPWAIGRAILGGLLLTPIYWSNGGPLPGLLQLAYSAGVLLLLVARPGAFRIALGTAAAGGTLALMLGVLLEVPAALAARDLAAGTLDASPHLDAAEGSGGRWRLRFPPGHWRESTERPKNVERVFVWPERRASVVVTVNPLGGGNVPVDYLADTFFERMQQRVPTFRVVERRLAGAGTGDLVLARFTSGGADPEAGWIGVHAVPTRFTIAVAAVPAGGSAETVEELLAVVSSLEQRGEVR